MSWDVCSSSSAAPAGAYERRCHGVALPNDLQGQASLKPPLRKYFSITTIGKSTGSSIPCRHLLLSYVLTFSNDPGQVISVEKLANRSAFIMHLAT